MIEYLKNRITRYWENAKIDYDVNGHLVNIDINGDRLLIEWVEEGTHYTIPVRNFTDYTPEEVFYIWCEQDWSLYAD